MCRAVRVGHVEFTKGEGTGNDFVILADAEGTLNLTESLVRALTDRHIGIGANGILRAVRTATAAVQEPELADQVGQAEWFMDYRNADGSLAQMCGNGARVFTRWLVANGWAAAGEIVIATRGGLRTTQTPQAGDVSIDMGTAQTLQIRLMPHVTVGSQTWPGLGVHIPNPHLVAYVDDEKTLAELDLSQAPEVNAGPAFPDGVNVEFVVSRGTRHVGMRVHERGVGETLSCGTGAGAVMVAAAARDQEPTVTSYQVDVPGGTLTVSRSSDDHIHLMGPANLVARGTVDAAWLESHR